MLTGMDEPHGMSAGFQRMDDRPHFHEIGSSGNDGDDIHAETVCDLAGAALQELNPKRDNAVRYHVSGGRNLCRLSPITCESAAGVSERIIMSENRVQQQQQQARMDAERMQKAADKASRQQAADNADRQQFSQLMSEGARQTHQERAKLTREEGAHQQQAKEGKAKKQTGDKKAEAQTRTARLARGGALHQSKVMQQAESFHSMLDANKEHTEGVNQVLHQEAEESRSEVQAAGQERAGDLEQKAEEQREMGKHEARLAAAKKDKPNAAISGDSPMSGESDDQRGEHADEAGVDAAKKAAGSNEVHPEAVQGAAGAK